MTLGIKKKVFVSLRVCVCVFFSSLFGHVCLVTSTSLVNVVWWTCAVVACVGEETRVMLKQARSHEMTLWDRRG